MGCGSALGDLFILADTLVQSQAPGSRTVSRFHRTGGDKLGVEDLRAQLYKMHGEGQIRTEVFNALRDLADQGRLRPADLAVHRARARRRGSQPQNREVANALRGIRSRQRQLSGARSRSEKVLADLEASIGKLDEKITDKGRGARQAVSAGNETAARVQLTEKEALATSRERLTKQAQAMRDDLTRLDDLSRQLEAKEVELEALRARGELASLGSTEET
jgi:hypothetical protein